MKVRLIKLLGLATLLVIVGCGVSEKTISNAEEKLVEFKKIGVPDSSLSSIKVYLAQTKDAQKRAQSKVARIAAASLKRELAAVESKFKTDVSRLIPAIDSLRSVIKATRSGLSGLQAKKLDSLMVPIDSLVNQKWYLQAYTKAAEIGAAIPQFNKDESTSKELRNVLPGQWVCTNLTSDKENKAIHAVEKKIFTFMEDGKTTLVENKKGQSGPFLKEDWEFRSWGTWDLHGDTIHLFINRFQSVRQNFQRFYVIDGKKFWKNEPQPTYDSTITDGSQDRYITYPDLKEDFERK
jgi:hypothetical protein